MRNVRPNGARAGAPARELVPVAYKRSRVLSKRRFSPRPEQNRVRGPEKAFGMHYRPRPWRSSPAPRSGDARGGMQAGWIATRRFTRSSTQISANQAALPRTTRGPIDDGCRGRNLANGIEGGCREVGGREVKLRAVAYETLRNANRRCTVQSDD
jgi:hypothetical protein